MTEKDTKSAKPRTNTTKRRENTAKLYSSKDICTIISTCKKNGVTNIKFSGIEICFMGQGTDSQAPGMAAPTKRISKKDSTPIEPLQLTKEELEEIHDIEEEQLALEDPIEFEAEMIRELMVGEEGKDGTNGFGEVKSAL